MGQIDDIQEQLDASNVKLGLVTNTVVTIGKDVKNLKAKIDELEQGSISQEQVSALKASANSISERVDVLTTDLNALDAETPDEEVPSPELPPVVG